MQFYIYAFRPLGKPEFHVESTRFRQSEAWRGPPVLGIRISGVASAIVGVTLPGGAIRQLAQVL